MMEFSAAKIIKIFGLQFAVADKISIKKPTQKNRL